MKWYIGQEIVCIKTHSEGVVLKGQVYTIKDIKQVCQCGVLLDVGIRINSDLIGKIVKCRHCYSVYYKDNAHWILETLFAPLDFDISELTELLKEPIEINK